VLLDNTYCCGILSADGHQLGRQRHRDGLLEREFAGWPRSYPAADGEGGKDALAYSPAGFIWDDALAHGKTVRDFGEFTTDAKHWKNPRAKGENVTIFSTPTAISPAARMKSPILRAGHRGAAAFMVTNTSAGIWTCRTFWRAAQFIKR
jgi:hypothetical protein